MSTTVFAVRELMRSGEPIYMAIGDKWLVKGNFASAGS
jgi:hypothetical protein